MVESRRLVGMRRMLRIVDWVPPADASKLAPKFVKAFLFYPTGEDREEEKACRQDNCQDCQPQTFRNELVRRGCTEEEEVLIARSVDEVTQIIAIPLDAHLLQVLPIERVVEIHLHLLPLLQDYCRVLQPHSTKLL